MPESAENSESGENTESTANREPAENSEPAEAAPVPPVADETLLAAHDLARTALLEITSESSVGGVVGHIVEGDHVLSLLFECTLLGYPGWHWTVTLARVTEDADPVVLEAELLPGERALLAPDWIPWSERLAEYQAAQEAARDAGDEDADAGDEDAEDDGDDEFDDDEGLDDIDIDGIDIDLHDVEESDDGGDEDESDTDDEDDIDVEADDIIGAESASLSDSTPGGPSALDEGVDEPDDAEGDADDGRRDDPAEA